MKNPNGDVAQEMQDVLSLSQTIVLIQSLSWQDIQQGYVRLVTEYVPGPLSLSYFVPFLLLPLALMVPPSVLSHQQLCWYFLPPIYAGVIHAWCVMGGVDVISVDGLLWSTLLIGFKDVRKVFARLVVAGSPRSTAKKASDGGRDATINGARGKSPSHDVSTIKEVAETSGNPQKAIYAPDGMLQTSEDGVFEQRYPIHFLPRLEWVLTLIASTRYHAWISGSPSRDSRQIRDVHKSPSRKRFVLSLVPGLVLSQAIILPLVVQLAMYDPEITSVAPPASNKSSSLLSLHGASSPPRTVVLLQKHVPPYVLQPLTTGFYAYGVLFGGWCLGVPMTVLSNYLLGLPPDAWSLHNLPSHFGSFSNVLDYGVGGLWGKWWHQHMRVMSSGPGLAVADYMGLDEQRLMQEKDSRRRNMLYDCRYTLQVISGFFFSGITHMGLVPPLAPGATGLRFRVASFFWLQAVAVIFERLVIIAFNGAGSDHKYTEPEGLGALMKKILLRSVTLVWVLTWLCLTLPLLQRPFDQLGYWKLWPPPGLPSQITYYLRGDWIP